MTDITAIDNKIAAGIAPSGTPEEQNLQLQEQRRIAEAKAQELKAQQQQQDQQRQEEQKRQQEQQFQQQKLDQQQQ